MELTTRQQAALIEYEALKIQEKELQGKMDELKEIILPAMEKQVKIEGEKGVFELKERTSWKFSEYVTRQEKELKVAKDDEIAKGIAKPKVTPYLEYRLSKPAEEEEGE